MKTKMKTKKTRALLLVLCCLLPAVCQAAISYQEDDLVFDDVGEETPTSSSNEQPHVTTSDPKKDHNKSWQRVEKLLGMPDAVAQVGHVFKLHVPKQAFSGSIDYYEARGINGKGLAHWLHWDEPAGALSGVPSRKDVGRHRVVIKAFGKHADTAQDSFLIHVVPETNEHFKHKDGKKRCGQDQERTLLTLLVDARYENLKPSAKVNALENLAGFLGLHSSSVSIQAEASKDSSSTGASTTTPNAAAGSSIVLSGPGNVARRREKHSTLVQWQVGCDGHFWQQYVDSIKQIPEQARDGTLTEVLQLPVYKWLVRSDATDYARNRRDTAPGSGDGFLRPDDDDEDQEYDEDDEDYDENYDDNNEGITDSPQEPKLRKPISRPVEGASSGGLDEHPHRHHHGEESIAGIHNLDNEDDFIWRNAEINNSIFNKTTTTTEPTTIAVTIPSSTTTTSTTSTSTTTTTTTTTTPEPSSTPTSTTSEPTTTPSTTTSTTTTTTEQPSTTGSTTSTTTTTTETTVMETFATENATSTSYVNLTRIATSGSNAPSNNVTIDSLLTAEEDEEEIDEEEDDDDVDDEDNVILTTDFDNETVPDITTTLQSNASVGASESTSTTTTTTMSGGGYSSPSGSVVESSSTAAEPNATSVFSVNATAEEYPELPVEPKEVPTSSSVPSWNDRVTEGFPGEPIDAYDPYDISKHVPIFNSSSSTTTTTTTTTMATPPPTTTSTTTTTTDPPTTPPTTTTEPPTPPTTPSTTTTTTTTTEAPTTRATTPERIDYGIPRNNAPRIGRRLKRIPVTQGKVLSYEIPEDAFNDFEDGNTRNLRLQVYEKDGSPLKPSYWLQFNENTQEIYGLPGEEVYSSYFFDVVATDRGGLSVSDKLEIVVQQHKQQRAFNHEFHVYLKIDERNKFRTNVDWQLKVMRSLAELCGDSDLSYITVRSVEITGDRAIYTWTNDSLARTDSCPHEEIDRLYSLLISNKKTEEPSEALSRVLGPEIKVERVAYQGLEQCQQSKETNVGWPIVRNQVDHLKALVGQLFVYKVKKDTFFDEDDGDTSKLKLSLYTGNRSDVPHDNWLQFDSKNQEFYGVPLKEDIGRKSYQLIAKDKEGLEATDSLVAEVKPLHEEFNHNVEIKMTINIAYDTFVKSAHHKRQFIQKLANVYGERNTSVINILSVSGGHSETTIVWRNFSLPENECPNDEITQIRRALVTEDKNYTGELSREFKDEFSINMISFTLTGECRNVVVAGAEIPTKDDTTATGARQEDYLITFVLPAAIIATMLILAGIIACILYKRRRSGKMSVSEKDDERQSFRSKGIPVIFQDELDEKPDPGNKSPIILKEEKPPLPPPEYQRAEDGADIPMLSKENSEEPYQPPPPFATNRDNNRQNRPKPTPTYRKPPPYVPP